MTHLDAEKTQRYRRQLLAAVGARYFWIALSIALIQWFSIPFARYITFAGLALGVMNSVALVSFWKLKFDRVMIYIMISSDSVVLLYALAATGLFVSPFTMVLIVVAAFTVLVTDIRYGFYTAAFSSAGYVAIGILAQTGKMPPELNIPQFSQITAILHMVVLTSALFSIVGILGFVVSRLQKSEAGYFEQGRQLAEKNHEMSVDLAIAATVQKAILAAEEYSDDRIRIAGKVRPMLEVGGDYFEIFRLATGETGVFVADVSGHGAGSALITAMLKVSLENAVQAESDAGKILGRINDDMCRIIGSTDFYLTGILCKIHPDSMVLEYSGAAHPEMFLLSEGHLVSLQSDGTILGKLPSVNFPTKSRQLLKGDRLVIYTDGITEARQKNGEFWGEGRLQLLLQEKGAATAADFVRAVIGAIDTFYGAEKPNDDRTLVAIDVLAEAREIARGLPADQTFIDGVEMSREALVQGNIQRIEEILAGDFALPLRVSVSLIRLLRRERGSEAAVTQLKKLVTRFGEHPALLEELGRTYWSTGNVSEARSFFERAMARDKTGYSRYFLAKMQST